MCSTAHKRRRACGSFGTFYAPAKSRVLHVRTDCHSYQCAHCFHGFLIPRLTSHLERLLASLDGKALYLTVIPESDWKAFYRAVNAVKSRYFWLRIEGQYHVFTRKRIAWNGHEPEQYRGRRLTAKIKRLIESIPLGTARPFDACKQWKFSGDSKQQRHGYKRLAASRVSTDAMEIIAVRHGLAIDSHSPGRLAIAGIPDESTAIELLRQARMAQADIDVAAKRAERSSYVTQAGRKEISRGEASTRYARVTCKPLLAYDTSG